MASEEQGVEETGVDEGSTADEPSTSNYLAYMINDVYHSMIVENVRPTLVISKMGAVIQDTGIIEQVYALDRVGESRKAAELFLNHLKNLEEPGKYQAFVQALRSGNKYSFIADALEQKPIDENLHEHKQLINIFGDKIFSSIEPDILSQALQAREVITADEGEKIRKVARNSSSLEASLLLWTTITRHNSQWYQIFLGILFDHGHETLVKDVDEKFYSQKRAENQVSDDVDTLDDSTSSLHSDDHETQALTPLSVATPHDFPSGLQVRPVDSSAGEGDNSILFSVHQKLGNLQSLVEQQTGLTRSIEKMFKDLEKRMDRLESKVDSLLPSSANDKA